MNNIKVVNYNTNLKNFGIKQMNKPLFYSSVRMLTSNTNQLSFSGDIKTQASKIILGDSFAKVISKTKGIYQDYIERVLNKLPEKNELPVSEKPIIAANGYDSRTIDLLRKLKEKDVDISSIGSIERSNAGGLQGIDKNLINNKIDDALNRGDITADTARSLKRDVSMCGNQHGADEMIDNAVDASGFEKYSENNIEDSLDTDTISDSVSDGDGFIETIIEFISSLF